MKRRFILGLAIMLLAAGSAGAQEIFDAVKANDLGRVKAIVEQNVSSARAKDASGNTPLHIAARMSTPGPRTAVPPTTSPMRQATRTRVHGW